jgi:hypothetical protein
MLLVGYICDMVAVTDVKRFVGAAGMIKSLARVELG